MAKVCIVTGKKVMFGNNVSHSNIKNKRRFSVNIHKLKFWVESKKKYISLKVSSKGLKIINKIGIDKFILSGIKYGKKK